MKAFVKKVKFSSNLQKSQDANIRLCDRHPNEYRIFFIVTSWELSLQDCFYKSLGLRNIHVHMPYHVVRVQGRPARPVVECNLI